MTNKNSILLTSLGILVVLIIIRAYNFNQTLNQVISVINIGIIIALFLWQQEVFIENIKSLFRTKK